MKNKDDGEITIEDEFKECVQIAQDTIDKVKDRGVIALEIIIDILKAKAEFEKKVDKDLSRNEAEDYIKSVLHNYFQESEKDEN